MTVKDLWQKATHFKQWLLFKKVEKYTMVGHVKLYRLYDLADRVERQATLGDFVECGVWKGGAAGVMAEVIKNYGGKRRLWLFDSFEGLPAPKEIDGQDAARQYQKDRGVSTVIDVEHVLFDLIKIKRELIKIVPGWFEDVLPLTKQEIGPISLLRLDGDWYESTKVCLDNLYEQVVPGGYVLVDDYGSWHGCRRAIDEFLEKNNLVGQLQKVEGGVVFWQKPLDKNVDQYWSVESLKYGNPHLRIRRIADEITRNDKKGKVLDVGCGPATLGKMLSSLGYDYAGIDVFEQSLSFGRYKVFDLNRDSFDLFPYREKFDWIIVSGVLEYLFPDRTTEFLRQLVLLSDDKAKIIITYTNFSHYSRKPRTYHPEWRNILSMKNFEEKCLKVGLKLERKYPSYYFVFGRRIGYLGRFWIPGLSKFFGRQTIYIFSTDNA